MTNRERLVAALIALSLAGNAAAQGGPLTPLDDPRRLPVLRGTDAGPADPRYFGGVLSGLVAGGRGAPSPYLQPSTHQIVSAGKDHHATPKLYEAATNGNHVKGANLPRDPTAKAR
jgi:hypothetical protein